MLNYDICDLPVHDDVPLHHTSKYQNIRFFKRVYLDADSSTNDLHLYEYVQKQYDDPQNEINNGTRFFFSVLSSGHEDQFS